MSFVADLRVVLEGRDFRRLFSTRLVSQFSDGIFQFGVAGFADFGVLRVQSRLNPIAAALVAGYRKPAIG